MIVHMSEVIAKTNGESSYRRGYHHAAHQVLIAIENGMTLAQARAWVDAVDDWRWHRTPAYLPPEVVEVRR
jgi:hypothetical protein